MNPSSIKLLLTAHPLGRSFVLLKIAHSVNILNSSRQLEDITGKGQELLKSIKGVGPIRQKAIIEITNRVLNKEKS